MRTKAVILTGLVTAFLAALFALPSHPVEAGRTGAASPTYRARFYVAGMGGHFADAECSIDPSKDTPITVNQLSMIRIGTHDSHPTHDPRIDVNDRNVLFWSTYKKDKATGKTHVGKTDLRTGEKIADVEVDVPPEATKVKSLYCASAQTKDYFIPISMANKGYIDIFRKSDLVRVRRVFLDGTEADIGKPYKFFHGTNSPDMTKMLITINESDTPHGTTVGKLHLIMLDMAAFLKGEITVLARTVLPGKEKKTVSFRQYFSHDGKLIANATGDRLFIVKADTLELVDAEILGGLEETHDAIFTPDDRYVVLTSRTKRPDDDCEDPKNPGPDEFLMDGQLKLYDVAAQKVIGTSSSVCLKCHDQMGLEEHAVLCGIEANWR